jgi:hypothetical protein
MTDGTRDKQLDHLHAIIERLAGNSFMIKGWAITVASGFLGFSIRDAKPAIALIGLLPTVMFWIVDAYYLAGERYFRDRYNDVLTNHGGAVTPILGYVLRPIGWFRVLWTPVVAALYLTICFCCILLATGLFVSSR